MRGTSQMYKEGRRSRRQVDTSKKSPRPYRFFPRGHLVIHKNTYLSASTMPERRSDSATRPTSIERIITDHLRGTQWDPQTTAGPSNHRVTELSPEFDDVGPRLNMSHLNLSDSSDEEDDQRSIRKVVNSHMPGGYAAPSPDSNGEATDLDGIPAADQPIQHRYELACLALTITSSKTGEKAYQPRLIVHRTSKSKNKIHLLSRWSGAELTRLIEQVTDIIENDFMVARNSDNDNGSDFHLVLKEYTRLMQKQETTKANTLFASHVTEILKPRIEKELAEKYSVYGDETRKYEKSVPVFEIKLVNNLSDTDEESKWYSNGATLKSIQGEYPEDTVQITTGLETHSVGSMAVYGREWPKEPRMKRLRRKLRSSFSSSSD
jgi:hypothetical protein